MRVWAMYEKWNDNPEDDIFHLAGPQKRAANFYVDLKNKWIQESPDPDVKHISYYIKEMELTEVK